MSINQHPTTTLPQILVNPWAFLGNSSEVLADSWLLYVYLVLNLMVVTLYMPSNVEAFLMGKGLVFFVELLDCLCRSVSLIRLAI